MTDKGTITWISVLESMPAKYEYVILRTPFCKYPAVIGFHNGLTWIDADLKTEVLNVKFFAYINIPHEES